MEEKLYQNIDPPQNNPLDIKEPETKEVDKETKKPINKKYLLLIILGSVTFVLLLIAIIVTQTRKGNTSKQEIIPTPSKTMDNPVINDSLIPSPYQEAFQQLDQSFSQDPDLPAPQIDIEVGQ
ncbi:hypothetical protein KKD37_00130 [Patescibacteria group bacterium]|nr:hypothetical protein [Patescibacteria group bacterium]